jgi:hypothetical protein
MADVIQSKMNSSQKYLVHFKLSNQYEKILQKKLWSNMHNKGNGGNNNSVSYNNNSHLNDNQSSNTANILSHINEKDTYNVTTTDNFKRVGGRNLDRDIASSSYFNPPIGTLNFTGSKPTTPTSNRPPLVQAQANSNSLLLLMILNAFLLSLLSWGS